MIEDIHVQVKLFALDLESKFGFKSDKNDIEKEEKIYPWLEEARIFIENKFERKVSVENGEKGYLSYVYKNGDRLDFSASSLTKYFENYEDCLFYSLNRIVNKVESISISSDDLDTVLSIRLEDNNAPLYSSRRSRRSGISVEDIEAIRVTHDGDGLTSSVGISTPIPVPVDDVDYSTQYISLSDMELLTPRENNNDRPNPF